MSCYMYQISAQDLYNEITLPDQDLIKLNKEPGNPGTITVSLEETYSDGWKGILLFDNEGNYTIVAQVNSSSDRATGIIRNADIVGKYFVLSKAKAGFVHTNVYWVVDAEKQFNDGDHISFTWVAGS